MFENKKRGYNNEKERRSFHTFMFFTLPLNWSYASFFFANFAQILKFLGVTVKDEIDKISYHKKI